MISVQSSLDRDRRMAFECPGCGKALKLPRGPGGKVKCPRNSCGTTFKVLPADLVAESPSPPPMPPIPRSDSVSVKSASVEPVPYQPEPPPLEPSQAKSRAAEPGANEGLFVCGSGSAPEVLLLTPTHLIFGKVQIAYLSQLRRQLRHGSFDSAYMPNPLWSIALKDLKCVETCAGDARGSYVRVWSRAQTGSHEKLVQFDKTPEGASFLNQLRAQLGAGWHERLCRDWQDFRANLGGFLFFSVFSSVAAILAFGFASGEWEWDTEQRVSILKLIVFVILWGIGTLLGQIGVILLWVATVAWAFYVSVYSSWRDSLRLLKLTPRKS